MKTLNFGFVVYGHQTFEEVNLSTNAMGLDTGCVYGNKLTAVAFNILDPQDYSIHSVTANS